MSSKRREKEMCFKETGFMRRMEDGWKSFEPAEQPLWETYPKQGLGKLNFTFLWNFLKLVSSVTYILFPFILTGTVECRALIHCLNTAK